MYKLKNSLGLSHEIIKKIVSEGDIVVDATAGNGHDTLMLAKLVGAAGKVYSFDIQHQAIENTRLRLEEQGFEEMVTLIADGHQNMDKHITEKVKSVMFNLGYLPGGNHNIGTRAETTIEALEKAMDLLEVRGIITVVVYYGGDSGFEEKDKLMEYIAEIDPKKFTVIKTEFVNQINCPPILVCIQKTI